VPPPGRLPHIIVLLDRWEGFTTMFGEIGGGALTDMITQLLAEGASAGIHLVMTGDRSLLAGRIAAMCEDKLALKLAEKDDYALIGLRPRDLPDDVPPGRGFWAGTGTQTQVALLAPDPTRPGRARPPPCSRSPPGRPDSTPGYPGRCARSGSTCCRRGSPSMTRGSCGLPRRGRARCGDWPVSAATS
jgi:hypothetical protein